MPTQLKFAQIYFQGIFWNLSSIAASLACWQCYLIVFLLPDLIRLPNLYLYLYMYLLAVLSNCISSSWLDWTTQWGFCFDPSQGGRQKGTIKFLLDSPLSDLPNQQKSWKRGIWDPQVRTSMFIKGKAS